MTFPNPFFTSGDDLDTHSELPRVLDGSRIDKFLRAQRRKPRPYNPQCDFRTVDAADRWGLSPRQARRRLRELIDLEKVFEDVVIYEGRSVQLYTILAPEYEPENSTVSGSGA